MGLMDFSKLKIYGQFGRFSFYEQPAKSKTSHCIGEKKIFFNCVLIFFNRRVLSDYQQLKRANFTDLGCCSINKYRFEICDYPKTDITSPFTIFVHMS